MRLDKFLKVSRLIKRRTVAKKACDAGKVSVNGHIAKASTEVEVGDELTLLFGEREVRVRVEALNEKVRAEEAATLYTSLDAPNA